MDCGSWMMIVVVDAAVVAAAVIFVVKEVTVMKITNLAIENYPVVVPVVVDEPEESVHDVNEHYCSQIQQVYSPAAVVADPFPVLLRYYHNYHCYHY